MLVLCCQFYPCSEAILSYARTPCPMTGLPPSMRLYPSRALTRMFVPTVYRTPLLLSPPDHAFHPVSTLRLYHRSPVPRALSPPQPAEFLPSLRDCNIHL